VEASFVSLRLALPKARRQDRISEVKLPRRLIEKIVKHVNRKSWWHVPPQDPEAYSKRGKFYAASFAEAEFYGRPNDHPEKVHVEMPLVGDERTISKVLGLPTQHDNMTLGQIATHDAIWRRAAVKKGFDSILLMGPKSFVKFKATGKLPRSLELNILRATNNDDCML